MIGRENRDKDSLNRHNNTSVIAYASILFQHILGFKVDISSSKIKWHDRELLNQTGPNADRQPLADLSSHPTIRSINLPSVCKVRHHNINNK
jgi:hypothetical protein